MVSGATRTIQSVNTIEGKTPETGPGVQVPEATTVRGVITRSYERMPRMILHRQESRART